MLKVILNALRDAQEAYEAHHCDACEEDRYCQRLNDLVDALNDARDAARLAARA